MTVYSSPKRSTLVLTNRILPAAILLAALLFTLYRCFFGVDFTDEAQYVAQAYAPLIGGVPFVTDMLLQQTVSLMLSPLLWLYIKLSGSSDGMVLFFRMLWLLTAGFTGWVIYRRFRPLLHPIQIALIVSFVVIFIPFGIPSPSYNTFGLLFLTLGLCSPVLVTGPQLFFLVVATICYLPFGIAVISVLLAGLLVESKRGLVLRYGFVLILVSAVVGVAAVTWVGLGELKAAMALTSSLGTFGGLAKLKMWGNQLSFLTEPKTVPISALLGSGVLMLLWSKRSATVFLILVSIFFVSYPLAHVPTHYWIFGISLIGLCLTLRKDALVPRPLVVISILCGLTAGMASSNGLVNAPLGCFSAFLAFFINAARHSPTRKERWGQASALTILLVAFASYSMNAVYRDAPVSALGTRVANGPYRGLFGTQERAAFITQMSTDLKNLTDGQGGIFFVFNFAAGYLLTQIKPVTWMFLLPDTEQPPFVHDLLFTRNQREMPRWLVRVRVMPGFEPASIGDSYINAVFSDNGEYSLVVDRGSYALYQRKGGN